MRYQIPQMLRRLLAMCGGAGLLLAFASLGLSAQQESSASQRKNSSLPSFCAPAPSSANPEMLKADARALLPRIPLPKTISHLALPAGVAPGIMGRLPGEALPDPDEFQALYGYSGPYYNTTNLDGQVVVLNQSIYTWPTTTWKVTGMLRNQSRCPVHVTKLTARLLGAQGNLLASVTTTVPVAELRPGEPGPFVIEAPLMATEVKTIDWKVTYTPAQAAPRLFTFETYEDGKVLGGSRYDLVGSIRNADTTPARDVKVVVAWLDFQGSGRVLYVASAKLRLVSGPDKNFDSLNLSGGEDEDLYISLQIRCLSHSWVRRGPRCGGFPSDGASDPVPYRSCSWSSGCCYSPLLLRPTSTRGCPCCGRLLCPPSRQRNVLSASQCVFRLHAHA